MYEPKARAYWFDVRACMQRPHMVVLFLSGLTWIAVVEDEDASSVGGDREVARGALSDHPQQVVAEGEYHYVAFGNDRQSGIGEYVADQP